MPRNARVYDCLVISPGDVDAERDAIDGAVQFYNTVFGIHSGVVVQTSRWEYAAPDLHGPPQAVINRQIGDHCELGIAVFWSRLGTPTDEHDSGSIEEIERLLARGARVMVYHCVRDVPQDRLRDSQYPLLQAKLVELKQRGLVKEFRTTEELTKLVLGHLGSAIMQATKDEATAAALRGTPEVEPEVLFATELFLLGNGDTLGSMRRRFVPGRSTGASSFASAGTNITGGRRDRKPLSDCASRGACF
jgi:hypothetical protein